MLALIAAATIAASPTPNPTPVPTVAPYTTTAVVSAYGAATQNAPGHTDISNALITYTKNTGTLRFGVTAGAYAFPTVGFPIVSTTAAGANTNTYGPVPSAYVAYVPSAQWTISLGKQATLIGQEDGFTFQNVDIQRGLGWSVEPAFSRGIRAAYAQGKFSGDLEFNDGYYSGSHRAIEGLAGWAPSAATAIDFVFIVPSANTPGNPTTAIANKAEYDLMLTQTAGKWTLTPYVLLASSPANASLGYTSAERAWVESAIADYAFNASYSVAARYEDVYNLSSSSDTSLNADLLGFGPGSRATSLTLTPQYKVGDYFVRGEYSSAQGTGFSQNRLLLEVGSQF